MGKIFKFGVPMFLLAFLILGGGIFTSRTHAAAYNLGMTFDQFADAYSANADIFGIPQFRIYDAEFVAGSVKNAYKYQFTSSLSLIVSVDKNSGLMRDVGILAMPQNDSEILDMLLAYGIIVVTLNPELSQAQRGQLMQQLYLVPEKLPMLIKNIGKAVRGNVRHQSVFVQEYGLFTLTATAKDL